MPKLTVRELFDHHDGELPTHTLPMLYPIVYYTEGGQIFCAKCATEDIIEPYKYGAHVVDWDRGIEGPDLCCDVCGAIITGAHI